MTFTTHVYLKWWQQPQIVDVRGRRTFFCKKNTCTRSSGTKKRIDGSRMSTWLFYFTFIGFYFETCSVTAREKQRERERGKNVEKISRLFCILCNNRLRVVVRTIGVHAQGHICSAPRNSYTFDFSTPICITDSRLLSLECTLRFNTCWILA